MMQLALVLAFLVATLTAWMCNSNKSSSINLDDTVLQQGIIDWVKASGGHFSPKQQFRRAIPGDPSSYFGIFATEDIKEGELLTSVPWSCVIIRSNDESDESDDEQGELYCSSYRLLMKEIRKGDKSFFAPYTSYLLKQPRGKLPSDWTEAGKSVLKEVIGDSLPPKDPVGLLDSWKRQCTSNDGDDPLEQLAFLEHHLRADDKILVPLYDLYNHANGERDSAKVIVSNGNKQDVYASRDIKKGEQICFSYELTSHMGGPSHVRWSYKHYGTAEFLRDYGFVESLPQRWIFPDQKTSFELAENESGERIKLKWIQGPPKHFSFFKRQLERLLKDVQPKLEQLEEQATKEASNKSLPRPYELAVIRQYFDALQTAISAAIETADTE